MPQLGLPVKLLVVDGAAPLRRRIVSAIAKIETVEVVGNVRHVREAVEEIRRLRPDVVILDVRLPGGSGIMMLETIKQESPSTIVMMFTDHLVSQYRDRCARAGSDYFFEHNVDFSRMVRVLTQLADDSTTKTA